MRNQWVADSADFGKYGLLRALCRPEPEDEYLTLRLGVVWYFTTGGPHDYLDPKSQDSHGYRDCDPSLYESLMKVRRSSPTIKGIEAGGVLPEDTVYFPCLVPKRQGKVSAGKRKKWAQAAHDKTADCDLVFVDPDTGIEPAGARGNTKPEHVRIDELTPYVERGQSLVVYQHQSRKETISEQVGGKMALLKRALNRPAFSMTYKRHKGDRVIFLVAPAPDHWDCLLARAQVMLSKGWCRHFLMVK